MVGCKSIAQKILAEKGFRVQFLVIQDKLGNSFYNYVLMTEADYQTLEKDLLISDEIEPAKYGPVMLKGVGNQPSEQHEKIIEEVFKEFI